MAESHQGELEDGNAPATGALHRAISGAVEAVTGRVRSAGAAFSALIGKSSGSIRAMDVDLSVIYDEAPALIRSVNPRLARYEVDEVVALLVDVELNAEPSEWSFVNFPGKRHAIVRRAVQNYIRGKQEYRSSRARADGVHLRWRGEASMEPLAGLYATELELAIERALKDLSVAHWETFCAVVYGGVSYREVAKRLGCTAKLISSRITDCRTTVRAVVAAYNHDQRSWLLRKLRLWAPETSASATKGARP